MSKIILVGIDGSQPAKKALEYAANLATKNDSHLYIVHVIEEFGELIQRWEQHDSYVEEVKRLSKDLLHESESRARQLGAAKIDIIEDEGDAAEKILQIAKDKGVDTIVVGNRGFSTAEEFLLGSVSLKLTHHAKCSVVVVR
ncbi:MAG: universal stress protein [Nitrososphaeraceae archaeon]|nr:universal stress protein [Nitrososphaeraceae archaeon]MBV9666886.1 universal stress protein [Nitrososphaeraceae archaeon]